MAEPSSTEGPRATAQAEELPAKESKPFDFLEHLQDVLMDPDLRKQVRENFASRKNTPKVEEHIAPSSKEEFLKSAETRLWIVDRVLEPQTLMHFLASLSGKDLPGAVPSGSNLRRADIKLISQPYSSWAPPPFAANDRVSLDRIMSFIGSFEDGGRLQIISKELHAMKSRLWEGIMPVSSRRWRDRQLDEPANFSSACRILSLAINVFLYLNNGNVQAALRETYNRIYDELKTFELALGAKLAADGKPMPQICRVWHDFMRAHFDVMINRTYSWIMDCLKPMKASVLEQLAAHRPAVPGEIYDEVQWKLMDMWQDLVEISACADYGILMPMTGYKGSSDGSEEAGEYDYRTQPLRIRLRLPQRRHEYHLRRRHLYMEHFFEDFFNQRRDPGLGVQGIGTRGIGAPGIGILDDSTPKNDPTEIIKNLQQQEVMRNRVGFELHGEHVRYETEPWASILWDTVDWGFVGYRTHASGNDEDWARFVAAFEVDIANWGHDLVGIGSLRERSKVYWIDARELGVDDHDIVALKNAYKEFTETAEFPGHLREDYFLLADEASIASYCATKSEGIYSIGGSILVIDASYNPEEGLERPDESPGFQGSLRILGSLLWDDLSALMATQTQFLEDLWPLAMYHPNGIYLGPISDLRNHF